MPCYKAGYPTEISGLHLPNGPEDRMLSYQSGWLLLIHPRTSVLEVDAGCVHAQVCMGRQLHLICRMLLDALLGRFPNIHSLARARVQMM